MRPRRRRTGGAAWLVACPGQPFPYPSKLSDREWALLALELPAANRDGTPLGVDPQRVLNSILSTLRSGCQWRMLPLRFGPWSPCTPGFARGGSLAFGRDSRRRCVNSCAAKRGDLGHTVGQDDRPWWAA
jgi:transposase